MIIAFAVKEVAILFSYDADVQTTLGDYPVLDAPSSVLPERIVNTHYFVVLKAGFMISNHLNLGSERQCASPIEIKRVITAEHLLSSNSYESFLSIYYSVY